MNPTSPIESWRERITRAIPHDRERARLAVMLAALLIGVAAATLFSNDAAPPNPSSTRLLIDPNRAGVYELMLLDNIGEATARKIIAEREANGPYGSPDDLQRVKGIGPKTVEGLRSALQFE